MINKLTYCTLLTILFIYCAKEGFPPGGPEDRIPPEVIHTIPTVGQTHVDTETHIEIWFSEGIQSASALNSVFITPYPGEDVKINCRGSKITIDFPQSLKSDLTYVITLGTGIQDYRNNSMTVSYTLAFSTGETLDRGEISGIVYDVETATGVDIWAYRLEENPDPNPILQKPDYVVQCSTEGEFRFSYLSPGIYRLYAIRDRISDRLYQRVEDEFGITYRDAFLSMDDSLNTDRLIFKMTREDTLGPSLTRAASTHRNHVTLLFDEPISYQSPINSNSFTIISEENANDTLSISQAYIDPLNRERLHILTDDQYAEKRYKITIHHLMDEHENPVDDLYNEAFFSGSGVSDTIPPILLQTMPSADDQSIPLNTQMSFIFSEAIELSQFAEGFSLSDSSNQIISGSIQWINPVQVLYQPDALLKSQTPYTIRLSGEKTMDLAGNAMADTVFQFQTLNQDTLSAILGHIIDDSSEEPGDIHIQASQIENTEIIYTQILTEPGEYHFSDVLPGQYIIECFRDRDGNGQFSYGDVFPYQPSERFVVYPDTVLIRSRWPNEGNDLILP